MADGSASLSAVFPALADPTRRAILTQLAHGDEHAALISGTRSGNRIEG